MEPYIMISYLNDFIFCPMSIYFHQLYGKLSTRLYQDLPQVNGKAVHKAIDENKYSTRKNILQGIDIYSDKYKLCGKIDIFDIDTGLLTERKKYISKIYDGYIFQLYAQYYCLEEMGYSVKELRFYSSKDNKVHPVPLPTESIEMKDKFEKTLEDIMNFNLENFNQTNLLKCQNCIYETLCDRSLVC